MAWMRSRRDLLCEGRFQQIAIEYATRAHTLFNLEQETI